jgi:hypothetical protein
VGAVKSMTVTKQYLIEFARCLGKAHDLPAEAISTLEEIIGRVAVTWRLI